MKTCLIILCFGAVVFLLVLPIQLRIRRNMQRYWNRACTGLQWRRRFPDAAIGDIRSFLELFVDAFAFSQRRRLCFSPDDKVMEIYHTRYPEKLLADCLELEFLTRRMQESYGMDLADFWREDITLGELFAHTRAA